MGVRIIIYIIINMKMNRAVLIPTTCKSSDEDTEVPEIKEKEEEKEVDR